MADRLRVPYLVDADTRKPLRIGQAVKTMGGSTGVLTGVQLPHKPASTGRVFVQLDESRETAAFFPSVINAVWMGRTDV